MSEAPPGDITTLLHAWADGDTDALNRLIPIVHDQLRRMARYHMRHEGRENTLQATALINEAYIRLIGADSVSWKDRAHFFAVSAQMMRRILVDAARARAADKRGGDMARIDLNESIAEMTVPGNALLALDDALTALASFDERKARVVEMKFFGGLSVEETASVLKMSPRSVMRDWNLARAWLHRELVGHEPPQNR